MRNQGFSFRRCKDCGLPMMLAKSRVGKKRLALCHRCNKQRLPENRLPSNQIGS